MAQIEVTVTGHRGFNLEPFACPTCGCELLVDAIVPVSDGTHRLARLLVAPGSTMIPPAMWVHVDGFEQVKSENHALRQKIARLEARLEARPSLSSKLGDLRRKWGGG